jgi:preprotein translocase subunit SecE
MGRPAHTAGTRRGILIGTARDRSLGDTEEGEVAESRRRGEDAVEENLDDAFDAEELDDAVEDDDALSEDEETPRRRGRGSTRTLEKAGRDRTDDKDVRVATEEGGPGAFGRLGRFVREVVAELRKVIWPTRKELLTYATVVVVFVAIMLTIVGLLDLGFAKGVLLVFGDGKK